jgi:hypothetical protein
MNELLGGNDNFHSEQPFSIGEICPKIENRDKKFENE